MITNQAIDKFWIWFESNRELLADLIDRGDSEALSKEIGPRLSELHTGLRWEVGPGKNESHSVTICSGGNPELRDAARLVANRAPVFAGWEFYSSRQPKGIPPVIEIPKAGLRLSTSGWTVSATRSPANERYDLVVFSLELAQLSESDALAVVFIWLDSALGEEEVEKNIGDIRVMATPRAPAAAVPIQELPGMIHRGQ